MRFIRSWWYIGANGMPTLSRTKQRAMCLSFQWGTKVTVFWVGKVVPICCGEGACHRCYTGPVTTV